MFFVNGFYLIFKAIVKRGVSVKFLMSSEATHMDRMAAHFKYLIRRFGVKVQVKFFKVSL